MDAWGLSDNLWPCWCLRAMLLPGPCLSEWPALTAGSMVLSGPGLLPRVMPGSVLMPMTPDAIEGCDNASGLVSHLSLL